MADESAKTTSPPAKKKHVARRRKKVTTTVKADASQDEAGAETTSTAKTKQVGVEDVAKRSEGSAATKSNTSGSAGKATSEAPKRKTTRRRTKKKKTVATAEVESPPERTPVPTKESEPATAAPTKTNKDETGATDMPETRMESGSASTGQNAAAKKPNELGPDGNVARRRTRRGRRGGRRHGTGRDRATQETSEVSDEPSQRSPATARASESPTAATSATQARSQPSVNRQEPNRSESGGSERARRRRGHRGANAARESSLSSAQPRTPVAHDIPAPAQVIKAAAAEELADDDIDDAFIDETEDTVEVGDVVFPKPDLKEKCKREMVINVTGSDECRIAILQEGRLEEMFIERASSQSHVGNIYKGRITNVEPSIQAAFVDFGLPKNGFLHISDVQPQYFPTRSAEAEEVGRKIPRHHRPPIQKCFRRGQEVMVQIIKEGVGTKGPTLTTYLSIPGRYLVMMPGMNRHGVSRKIEDDEERRKMKDVMNELTFPSGMGFILRTAGMGQTKRELQRDLNYLVRLWKRVIDRVKRMPSPAELYKESDLVTRTIRDVYSTDFERLIVDDAIAAKKAKDFFHIAMPRSKPRIEVYTDPEPLFHTLGIEDEIERINARHVPLKSGGSLVIDSTEALVAIDVNSGRYRALDDAEETALRINLEAAEEIARQLRLRDLGGLIVCDFIDLRLDRNKRAVERALRDALKKHKERARILRMSAFGLIEMTRQRQGPSLKRNTYFDCPHCRGSGLVKMPESVILDVMRTIQLAAHNPAVRQIRITVSTEVAHQILNSKRGAIGTVESATGKKVTIRGDLNFTSDQVECVCEDDRGQPLVIPGTNGSETPGASGPPRRNG